MFWGYRNETASDYATASDLDIVVVVANFTIEARNGYIGVGCEAIVTARDVASYGYGTPCVINTPACFVVPVPFFYLTLARTMAGLLQKNIQRNVS